MEDFKGYNQLTDDQLIELHRKAHGLSKVFIFQVERHSSNIRVSSAVFTTMFKVRTGAIIPLHSDKPDIIRNLWVIINLLRDWGVTYDSEYRELMQ